MHPDEVERDDDDNDAEPEVSTTDAFDQLVDSQLDKGGNEEDDE